MGWDGGSYERKRINNWQSTHPTTIYTEIFEADTSGKRKTKETNSSNSRVSVDTLTL